MAGEKPVERIVPFRGDYYKLREGRTFSVRHLIYPVPDPKYPFLGVHFTRMIQGGLECWVRMQRSRSRGKATAKSWISISVMFSI